METEDELHIVLDRSDFENALGAHGADRLRATGAILAGESTGDMTDEDRVKKRLVDALPKVLATRLEKMIPDSFELQTIELKVAVDAKLFGTGVAGHAVVKFGRKARPVGG